MSTETAEKASGGDNLNLLVSRPLPKGSMIEYCGHEAIVLEDDGGERIDVLIEDTCQRWWWEFEGVQCTVISTPANVTNEFPNK